MRLITTALCLVALASCAHVRTVDAELYGDPPDILTSDVVVIANFQDAFSTSVACGRKAFGPLGTLLPAHGCVHAEKGKPVEMILTGQGPALTGTRIVEFVDPERAEERCRSLSQQGGETKGLPDGGCLYEVDSEDMKRIIWPNPCATGDAYLCHELAHVNQFALGWKNASLSPARHWGRPPEEPRYLMAEDETETPPAPEAETAAGTVLLASVEPEGIVSHHHLVMVEPMPSMLNQHRLYAPVPEMLVSP